MMYYGSGSIRNRYGPAHMGRSQEAIPISYEGKRKLSTDGAVRDSRAAAGRSLNTSQSLSLIHISEPTRLTALSRMPSSA